MGNLGLNRNCKIGYNAAMVRDVIAFVLRIGLVVGVWGLIWSFCEPKTQALRVLRAALLVLGLLGVWAILSIAGA